MPADAFLQGLEEERRLIEVESKYYA